MTRRHAPGEGLRYIAARERFQTDVVAVRKGPFHCSRSVLGGLGGRGNLHHPDLFTPYGWASAALFVVSPARCARGLLLGSKKKLCWRSIGLIGLGLWDARAASIGLDLWAGSNLVGGERCVSSATELGCCWAVVDGPETRIGQHRIYVDTTRSHNHW